MDIRLTEKHSVNINTTMEKHVLLMLFYYSNFSAVKIDNTSIYLHANSKGEPEVITENNIAKAKVDIISNSSAEHDVWVNVSDVVQQLVNAPLIDKEDGNFSYIDWKKEFITVSTSLSEANSAIRFRLDDIPALRPEHVEICNSMYPQVENIGLQGDNIFQALITSRIVKAKLCVNINDPLSTYVVEV